MNSSLEWSKVNLYWLFVLEDWSILKGNIFLILKCQLQRKIIYLKIFRHLHWKNTISQYHKYMLSFDYFFYGGKCVLVILIIQLVTYSGTRKLSCGYIVEKIPRNVFKQLIEGKLNKDFLQILPYLMIFQSLQCLQRTLL